MLTSITVAPELKAAWEAAVNGPRLAPADIAELVAAFRAAPPTAAADAVDDEKLADALWASAIFTRVAFVLPELGMATYDRLADLFLDGVPLAFSERDLGPAMTTALAAPGRL